MPHCLAWLAASGSLLFTVCALSVGAGSGDCGPLKDCEVLFQGIQTPPTSSRPHPDTDPHLYAHGHSPSGGQGGTSPQYVCFRNPALLAAGGALILFVEGRREGCGDFDGPHEILARTSRDGYALGFGCLLTLLHWRASLPAASAPAASPRASEQPSVPPQGCYVERPGPDRGRERGGPGSRGRRRERRRLPIRRGRFAAPSDARVGRALWGDHAALQPPPGGAPRPRALPASPRIALRDGAGTVRLPRPSPEARSLARPPAHAASWI